MSIRKYKLKNGKTKYQARILLNGRGSKQVSKAFDRRSDAEAYLNKFRSDSLDSNNPGESSFEKTNFKKEAEFWIHLRRKQISPSSELHISACLLYFIEKVGNLKPNELHSGKIVLLQQELLATGLSPRTVNKKISVIHSILNFSAKMKRIPYNPCSGYPKLKEIHPPMNFWTKDEASKFLEYVDAEAPKGSEKRWVYVALLLAINTGLRAGELWGLTLQDLDLSNDLLRVSRQLDRVKQELRTTKSRKSRIVPCNPVVKKELEDWIRFRKVKSTETIFQASNRKPVDHDNFRHRIYSQLSKQSGVRPIRFHDLRHTAATLMISSRVDIMTVKEILGHSNIKTTLNYVHLVAENVKNVAKNFSIEPNKMANVLPLKVVNEKDSL